MARKMHAAVVEQFGKPLSLLELEIPLLEQAKFW